MNIKDLEERIVSYRKEKGFVTSWDNLPEKLMLIVCEVAETMEAYRKVKLDEGNIEEEFADIIIRVLDCTGSVVLPSGRCINIVEALEKKMNVNEKRPFLHGKKL